MSRPARLLGLLLGLAAALAGGCAGSTEPIQYHSRLVPQASPDEVLDVAAAVLRDEFGRVQVDRAARRIVSEPMEFSSARDTGTARELLGGRANMRRVAMFSAVPGRDGTLARLRVELQRRDTGRDQVAQPWSTRLSDLPSQTAIERDAARSARQNEVWTLVRRDHDLERELLDDLLARLAPDEGPPPAPADAHPSVPPTGEDRAQERPEVSSPDREPAPDPVR